MHGMEAELRAPEVAAPDEVEAPHEVVAPERQTLPLVFASPHSGTRYPQDFVAGSRLDRLTLRRSEDSPHGDPDRPQPSFGQRGLGHGSGNRFSR